MSAADPLAAPGVAVDPARLLALRLLAQGGPRLPPPAMLTPGALVSRRRGRGLEAVDVRPFVYGDDPRHVDRNATARTGAPHVRSYHDESAHDLLLIADFRPSMLWGARGRLRSVAAAEALALAGWRAAGAGGRVGLLAFGAFGTLATPLRPGDRGMEAAVGGLAAAHAQALALGARGKGGDLAGAFDHARGLAPRGAGALLATGFEDVDDAAEGALRALDRRAALRVALVRDAFEVDPPAGAYPVAVEGGAPFWAFIGRRRPRTDPRAARLAALGLAAAAVDCWAPAEAMLGAVAGLHGRR